MSDNPISRSPLESLSSARYQGKTYQQERALAVGAARVTALENNPNRIAWEIINTSLIEIRISSNPTVTAATGFLLSPQGGIVSMDYQDDGEAVGYEVYAIGTAAGGTVWLREVIRS